MSLPHVSQLDVESYGAMVSEAMGVQFDPSRREVFERALQERLHTLGLRTLPALKERFNQPVTRAQEVAIAARAITVGETYFFRYPEQFRALSEVVLPDLWKNQSSLRMLSAGCASGEEVYSLACVALHRGKQFEGCSATIYGGDVNVEFLAKARRGQYTAWSFRQEPLFDTQPYIQRDGNYMTVMKHVRDTTHFRQLNLFGDDFFWSSEKFDVVFCRNVLIYFSAEAVAQVLARLLNTVKPGGYLFLGHAENLRNFDAVAELRHTHDAFYYRKSDSGRVISSALRNAVEGPDPSWTESINNAQTRILALSEVHQSDPVTTAVSAPSEQLHRAQALFQQERYNEALQLLQSLPPDACDVQALLLQAAILTNNGNVREAESLCEQILQHDSLHAGAYYLVGLCREQARDNEASVRAIEMAAHLDTQFAMPHVQLGRLWRRLGNDTRAASELKRALFLLRQDDASRIAMFGGGFTRESLIRMCERELSNALEQA